MATTNASLPAVNMQTLLSSFADALIARPSNPLKDAAYREAFLDQVARARIEILNDLATASKLLDSLVSWNLHRSKAVPALLAQARAFIARFPQLLETGLPVPVA